MSHSRNVIRSILPKQDLGNTVVRTLSTSIKFVIIETWLFGILCFKFTNHKNYRLLLILLKPLITMTTFHKTLNYDIYKEIKFMFHFKLYRNGARKT